MISRLPEILMNYEAFEALKNCKEWSKEKHVSKEVKIIRHNKICHSLYNPLALLWWSFVAWKLSINGQGEDLYFIKRGEKWANVYLSCAYVTVMLLTKKSTFFFFCERMAEWKERLHCCCPFWLFTIRPESADYGPQKAHGIICHRVFHQTILITTTP